MGKALILCIFLLLSGCAKEEPGIRLHQLLEVTDDCVYTTDGTYVYKDYDISTRRALNPTDTYALYLIPTGEPYTLTPLVMNSYNGSIYDFSNYIAELELEGYTRSSYIANSEYIDIMLCNSTERVRGIYFKDGRIKLYHSKLEVVGEK